MKDYISMNNVEMVSESNGYSNLLDLIQTSFEKTVNSGQEKLFTTDASDLYDLFLLRIPDDARQEYNCRTCRNFVDRFGGLVKIMDDGTTKSVMWSFEAPPFFKKAVDDIRAQVESAKVTGVFVSSQQWLGNSVTGCWHHMAVKAPPLMIYKSYIQTASQEIAEKEEDHWLLCSALSKYNRETVSKAVNLLEAGVLYRRDKVLGVARWLLTLMDKLETANRGKSRGNLIWKASAEAPDGFCHVSSSMIGTLLDDIQDGLDLESVRDRFAKKMDPLQYQRPQVAPSAGNVERAEAIVQKLGLAPSLRRRFARLEDLRLIWCPCDDKRTPMKRGVFADVMTKDHRKNSPVLIPRETITWVKFRDKVLPRAREIKYFATSNRTSYSALVTAADPLSPPILQWDKEENRNPVSWYVYSGLSSPYDWSVAPGWVRVTGITLQPNMWQTGFEHQGKSVFFLLEGCMDLHSESAGLAIFPETLRGELREVRSTIEAFSRKGRIESREKGSACGIRLQESRMIKSVFLVTTDTGDTEYTIDRWD